MNERIEPVAAANDNSENLSLEEEINCLNTDLKQQAKELYEFYIALTKDPRDRTMNDSVTEYIVNHLCSGKRIPLAKLIDEWYETQPISFQGEVPQTEMQVLESEFIALGNYITSKYPRLFEAS